MGNITLPIPVYLVSLDKDFGRRMILGVNYDYRHAVNGYELDKDKLIRDKIVVRTDLKKGEIGCYFSHVDMLKKAMASGNKYVFIMEDDAKIPKDLDIMKIINESPKDFQLLFLGYTFYEHFGYEEINNVWGLHGYVVNTENLKNLDALFPISDPIDVVLARVYKSYIVVPKAVELNSNSGYSNTTMIV